MQSRSTRQYWDGQWDALRHCATVIRRLAETNPTPEQLNRLALAIETKARLTATYKLGKTDLDK